MRQFLKAFGFAAVLLVTSMHAASAFGASFSWSGIRACGRTSPAFTIQDAPEGTERLRFVMIDKDAPNFRHGGSTIPYNGSGRVPEGAIDYIGPCPPTGTNSSLRLDDRSFRQEWQDNRARYRRRQFRNALSAHPFGDAERLRQRARKRLYEEVLTNAKTPILVLLRLKCNRRMWSGCRPTAWTSR